MPRNSACFKRYCKKSSFRNLKELHTYLCMCAYVYECKVFENTYVLVRKLEDLEINLEILRSFSNKIQINNNYFLH